MAEIFNKNTYTGKYWDVAVAIHRTNAAPLDSTEIFTSYDDALAYAQNGATAYFGLTVSVITIENDIVTSVTPYIIDADADGKGTLKLVATGTIDIAGKVVNIYYDKDNDKFYNEDTDPQHTTALSDTSGLKKKEVSGVTQYLCLTIGGDDMYIDVADMIDIKNYYTKTEINTIVEDLDSSVNDRFEDLDTSLNTRFDNLNTSVNDRFNDLDSSINDKFGDLNSSLNTKFSAVDASLDDHTSRIEELEDSLENVVESYVKDIKAETSSDFVTVSPTTSSKGNVTLTVDVSIANVSTATEESNGLASALSVKQYVDSKVGEIKAFNYKVVDSLPEASKDTMYVIYLIKNTDDSTKSKTNDYYDEWLTIEKDGEYAWELIGNTHINLSEYTTNASFNASIAELLEEIDDLDSSLSDAISALDSSMSDAYQSIEDINDAIDEINETLDSSIVRSIKSSTSSQYITVNPTEVSRGNVELAVDASVANTYTIGTTVEGLATTNYIEQRLSWTEIDG